MSGVVDRGFNRSASVLSIVVIRADLCSCPALIASASVVRSGPGYSYLSGVVDRGFNRSASVLSIAHMYDLAQSGHTWPVHMHSL